MKLFFSSMIAAILLFSGLAIIKSADVASPPISPQLLAVGKQIYGQQCAACHGVGAAVTARRLISFIPNRAI